MKCWAAGKGNKTLGKKVRMSNRTFLGLSLALWVFSFPFSPSVWSMAKRPPAEPKTPSKILLPPLTLADGSKLALKQSEIVAIQKEAIKNAEAQFFKATSEALGDVDFVITNFQQDAPEGSGGGGSLNSTFSAQERRERKFVVSQPLFQGFKSLAALRGAGSLKRERREEWKRAKELLFLDVVRAFYGLLRYQKDLAILEAVHHLLEERIRDLGEREKIGRSRSSEVVTARARIKIIEAEQASLKGSAAASRHLLEFLTGISLENRKLQEENLPEDAAPTLEILLPSVERRSDVQAAKEALKIAWQNVIVAQSKLWPEVSLENNDYVHREGFQSGFDWDLLLKVNVPLFRGGETVGAIKEAVSSWKKAKLTYLKTKREAELEIKEAYENWHASLDQSKALEEAVKASEENFHLQKEEYEHHLVNNLDVLAALEALHQTRRDANQIDYQMKTNYWSLQVAAGQGDSLANRPHNHRDLP